MQVHRDFRRAEADMILRQVVMEAHDHRLPVTGHYGRPRGGRGGGAYGESPDALRRVGRIEHPGWILLGAQLVMSHRVLPRRAVQLGPALVVRAAAFTSRGIGVQCRGWIQADGWQRGDGAG
ncbi:hypothetical protein D9M68_885000 [compost metagenome]